MTFDSTVDDKRRIDRAGRILRGAEDLQDIALSCELTAREPENFSATLWSISYENAAICRFLSTPIAARRKIESLGDPFTRFVQFDFLRSGSLSYSQRDCHGILRPGEASALLLDEPYVTTMLEDTELVEIYLPSDLLGLRGVPVGRLAGCHWKSSPLIDTIISFVTRLTAPAPGTDNIGGAAVERSLLELTSALVGEVLPPARPDFRPDEAMLQRTLEHIHEHATEWNFSVESICVSLHITRRHLYGLFEGRSMTLTQLIGSKRVEAAKRLLLDPSTPYTIPEIAARTGFAGGDQLTRTFKARYGITPVEYRARIRDVQRHGHW